MAFINRVIGPDEQLIGIARLHWIYGMQGLMWFVGLILLGGIVKLKLAFVLEGGLYPIGNAVFWICLSLGVVLFITHLGMMLFTELGLTTERCIYKRGLLFVKVREIDLEEIKSASVDNGYLGRILNYGYIKLDARFINDISFPAVNDPYRFTKALNDVRSDIKEDSMHIILDGSNAQIKEKHEYEHHNNDSRQRRHQEHDHQQHQDKLEDDQYSALSQDPETNLQELKKAVHGSIPEVSKKHKLFVHEEAIHNRIIHDFKEAEEKTKKS